VPLRPGVQNPQNGLQDGAGRHRLATRAALRDMFFGKMFPNALSLVVAQSQHAGALYVLFASIQLF
jgi:hypothetical protein